MPSQSLILVATYKLQRVGIRDSLSPFNSNESQGAIHYLFPTETNCKMRFVVSFQRQRFAKRDSLFYSNDNDSQDAIRCLHPTATIRKARFVVSVQRKRFARRNSLSPSNGNDSQGKEIPFYLHVCYLHPFFNQTDVWIAALTAERHRPWSPHGIEHEDAPANRAHESARRP